MELEEFLVVAEELDSFVLFSLEEDFSLPELFCELEDRSSSLEAGTTEDEESSAGSGETEEDSSPHATSMVRRTEKVKKMDCFVTLAMTCEVRAAEPLASSIAEPMVSCALRNT